MKVPFKSVGISVFVHATESEEKLKNAFRIIIPEEVEIERGEVEGHYGDDIVILSADFQRRPLLRDFWNRVLENLVEGGKRWLERNAVERIGDDCRLYLRFDKQRAVSDGELKFSESGSVIHVRINISAYPAKRKIAVEKMREFVDEGLNR